jgi:hypothetical protein
MMHLKDFTQGDLTLDDLRAIKASLELERNVFTLDELQAITASIELKHRNNLSPILIALALLAIALFPPHTHDWTDVVCIVWGTVQLIYFTYRRLHDIAIYKKAKAIIEACRRNENE